MGTVKVLLVDEARANGKFPVKIRVGHQRKYSYELLFYVKKNHWNASSVQVHTYDLDYKNKNLQIAKRYKEVSELVEHYDAKRWPYTAQDILAIKYAVWKEDQQLIVDQARIEVPNGFIAYITNVIVPYWKIKKNLGNAGKYALEAELFSRYLATLRPARKDVPMPSFTNDLVESYFAWLRTKKKPVRKDSTLKRKLAQIDAVLRFAHKKGAIPVVPELDMHLNVLKARKPKLVKDQIDALESYQWDFENVPFRHQLKAERNLKLAVQTFLFQYYLFGARVGDVLQLKNKNVISKSNVPQRIEYYQQKGRKNEGKKLMSIVINDSLKAILSDYYRPQEPDAFLLPWMQGRYEYDLTLLPEQNAHALNYAIHQATSSYNICLKRAAERIGLDVPTLASHSARHTFAQRAKKKGLSIEWLKDAFNHSTYDITATYLDDLDMDELNENMQAVYSD